MNSRQDKIISALNLSIMDNKTRKSISSGLKKYNNYFPNIPLDRIFQVLEDNGVTPVDIDNTKWSGFLCGHEGRVNFPIAFNGTKKDIFYTPVENSCLVLTWYKLNSVYEVVCYIG